MSQRVERVRGVDPDPVSVGLMILSATASVTTVVAYLDRMRERLTSVRRRRVRLKVRPLMRRLRNELNHLRAAAQNIFEMAPADTRDMPFRFGHAPLLLTRREFDIFSEEYSEILHRISAVQRYIQEIILALTSWPDAVLDLSIDNLREANTTANRVLDERMTLASAYRMIQSFLAQVTEQLSQFDDYLEDEDA